MSAIPEQVAVRPRLNILKPLAAAVALAGVAFYGIHWWSAGRFVEDTDDAYVGGDTTVLGAKVPGYVQAVAVSDNQFVHKGDLLVKLDDRDYRAVAAKAEAAVAAQQAALGNLDAQAHLQESVIAQAQAALAAANAEAKRSRLDDARYRELADRAAVSVESAQRAEASFATAAAATQRASAAVQAAQRQ